MGCFFYLIKKRLILVRKLVTIEDFLNDQEIVNYVNDKNAIYLSEIFNEFGSDKSRNHNYQYIYQPIIDRF